MKIVALPPLVLVLRIIRWRCTSYRSAYGVTYVQVLPGADCVKVTQK